MGSRLFHRVARVTAFRANPGTPGGFVNSNPTFFDRLSNAVEITQLRIRARIDKSIDKSPNKLHVIITNCSPSTRDDLTTRPLTLQIDAGYDGTYRHLFTGDMRRGWSELKGTDWETNLHLADGDRAYRFARVSRTYKRGTAVLTALKEAARSMGLVLDDRILASPELQTQFENGRLVDGPARDELTALLAPFGYGWSIQDGRLQILRDEEVRADQAIVIEEPLMIGSPEFAVPDQPKKVPQKAGAVKVPKLKIKVPLAPEITPGGRIQVHARSVDGIFKVQRVGHDLDTGRGGNWFTEIEANAA
jgi:hypothetical protein